MHRDEQAIRSQLSRIIESRSFRNAQRLRAFLQFVVEETLVGREASIKEYSIGCEVCGRSESFDPKLDPIVRVDANRLRSRLERYYQGEGAIDTIVIALPKGAYVPTFTQRVPHPLPNERPISLAVLPFASIDSPDHDSVAEGLTEELIHSLARLTPLKVIGRSSVFQLKNLTGDARALGDRLGATYILEGALRIAERRLRVTVRLIECRHGWLLWSERYDCAWHDVLDMQDEIAASITDALTIQLTGTGKVGVFAHATEDPEAYGHYLKGRYYWHQRTPAALTKSVRSYEQALEKDASCAPAYAGLADTLAVMALNDQEPTLSLMPRAKGAVRRALELRPGWPEALTSLGLIKSVFEWDWKGGERDFQEATQQQPGYSTAHYLYGIINLMPRGLWEPAVHSLLTALSLDPVSPVLLRDLGLTYFMQGVWDQAQAYLSQAEELAPSYQGCLYWRARMQIETGKIKDAITTLQARAAVGGANTRVLATIAYAHARGGSTGEALSILEELKNRTRTHWVPPLDFATIWLGLGEAEQALDYLEKACQERSAPMYQFGVDSIYRPVRSHPRGRRLLETMHLDSSLR